MMHRSGPRPTLTSNQKALYRSQVTENSSHSVSGNITDIYKPIRAGLDRVQHNLESVCEDNSPFVNTLLRHVLGTSGKGVRPAITLLASRFHKNDGYHAEIMASAVELLHVATLIHDDTVDASDFRRGKTTINNEWGSDTAVLLGDYLFATSAVFVCDTENIRVVRRFSETIVELSNGELDEVSTTYDYNQNKEQYFHRIYCKTASLFTTAAETGAILSGASEEVVQALKQYGYNLGMAYQIMDDILDLKGDSTETGKPECTDLGRGILTLPAIIAMDRNREENPIKMFCLEPTNSDYFSQAINLLRDSIIVEESLELADSFTSKAINCLDPLTHNDERESLEGLVTRMVRRRS